MKAPITTTLALILGLAIGALAGHYHGVATTLESMMINTVEKLP